MPEEQFRLRNRRERSAVMKIWFVIGDLFILKSTEERTELE
jgi:hypothetical protein